MKVEGRRYRDEWIPNYYPSRPVGEHRVRVSRTGRLAVLDPSEDRQLDEISMEQELFDRLERSGHLLSAANATTVLEDLKTWFAGTYSGPQLHIVVTTRRCNLNCTYCHMLPQPVWADASHHDLQLDVADDIVRFILSTPNPRCMIEFQGGEPFLNFPAIQRVVETARRLNDDAGKVLDFTVVSNLMVVSDAQLAYCADNGINISYSLNGPEEIHDQDRVSRNGHGSYARVVSRIDQIRDRFPGLLSSSPLCVVTGRNAHQLLPTVDYFRRSGFDGVAIVRLRPLGNARTADLGFDMEQFLQHYLAALDHIVTVNDRDGSRFAERMLRVVLAKLLNESDVGFVDWRNPCGDVSCTLTYDHDGEILPSDEARSLRQEFSLGNVRTTSYDQLVSDERTFRTMNLSLRDRDAVCRECAYNPYCGVAPILDFARTGDATPRPHESEECLFTLALLDWTIDRFMKDPVPLVRMLPGGDDWLASLLAADPAAG